MGLETGATVVPTAGWAWRLRPRQHLRKNRLDIHNVESGFPNLHDFSEPQCAEAREGREEDLLLRGERGEERDVGAAWFRFKVKGLGCRV